MTTDPGDLVLDPTCGSGTTAYVAEQWGRRWITCDTSRVAVTLAKQRLMTAVFDYYELAHPTRASAAGSVQDGPARHPQEHRQQRAARRRRRLYDQTQGGRQPGAGHGPFTVEAVPAPTVGPLTDAGEPQPADASVARSGETLRQAEWRAELLKTGIRGKNNQMILFSRVEPLAGTRWLHADAESLPNERGADRVSEPRPGPARSAERVVISFGPEHAPLEQRQVELAWEEARTLSPRPGILAFAAFQFDPEAAKDIDELTREKTGMTFLKVQMNPDLLTEDLKKKRASNESFWLMGQPDVEVRMWQGRAQGQAGSRGARLRLLQHQDRRRSSRATRGASPCGCSTPTTTAGASSRARSSSPWRTRRRLGAPGPQPQGGDRRGADRGLSRHGVAALRARATTSGWPSRSSTTAASRASRSSR